MSGDYEKADNLCKSLQKEAPQRPVSALVLGNINLSRGKVEDARRYFNSAMACSQDTDKTKAEALLGLGRLASMDSRSQEALNYYHQAAGLDPTNARALSSQAILLERQEKYEDALRVYALASSLAPDDASLQAAAGQIRDRLAAMEDKARAVRIDRLVEDILSADRIAPVASVQAWTSPPLTIWLLDFETSGFSSQEGAERLIRGLIEDRMVKNNRVQMVERALLDKLLAELKLGSSRLTDRSTALSVGRLAAARGILSGRLLFMQGHLRAAVRLIDCETGLVRASMIEAFDQTASPDAVAERLFSRIINELQKNYPIRATIAAMRQGHAIIDAGQRHGVAPGMSFSGQAGAVTVRVRSAGNEESEADVIAGQSAIEEGMQLQERIDAD